MWLSATRTLQAGVPVAVKDEVDQMPYGTTVGTRFLGQSPATEDATVVARLRAAGAMVVDAAPGQLATELVDKYLEVKASGRL